MSLESKVVCYYVSEDEMDKVFLQFKDGNDIGGILDFYVEHVSLEMKKLCGKKTFANNFASDLKSAESKVYYTTAAMFRLNMLISFDQRVSGLMHLIKCIMIK